MSQIISMDETNIIFHDISYNSPHSYASIRKQMFNNASYLLPIVKSSRTIHTSKIKTTSYYEKRFASSVSSYKDHLYPIAVRYVSKDNQFVIERPPFQLEVDFRLGSANSAAQKLPPTKIWIPWTVMVLKLNSLTSSDFSSVKLFFNDGPITSMDDAVLAPWLPNSYSSGSICFSNSLNDFTSVLDTDQIVDGDLGYIYNYIFNNYMMGGWNSDLNLHFSYLNVERESDPNIVPVLYNYNNPSKQTIAAISSNYTDPENDQSKFVKKCLSSKSSVTNYRNSVNAYVKHFCSLSALTLEETLQLITDVKKYRSNYANKFTINNILSHASSMNNRDSQTTFINNFNSSVMSNPLLDADHDYKVTDNYVYFETSTFLPSSDNGIDTTSLNTDYYSYSDNLYSYIGPKNMCKLEQFLIKLNDDDISNKIIHCSFDDQNNFVIDVLSEDHSLSSLLVDHKEKLINALNGLTGNTKQSLLALYNTFITEKDEVLYER